MFTWPQGSLFSDSLLLFWMGFHSIECAREYLSSPTSASLLKACLTLLQYSSNVKGVTTSHIPRAPETNGRVLRLSPKLWRAWMRWIHVPRVGPECWVRTQRNMQATLRLTCGEKGGAPGFSHQAHLDLSSR